MDVLGIDVGKRDLHATLLQNDRTASKSVPNSETGIAQLLTWLKNRNADRVHACLEATGGWSEQVAISLCEAGHVVSIVNPARIKAFAQSEMVRTKTDRIDAALIARFCRLHQPEPWTPPAPEIRILQGLVRRQHSLIQISIPGIAESTAARILGEMPNIAEFRDVKAIAAYAGLSPRHEVVPILGDISLAA